MTKIICRASDCVYWEDGLCTSDEITYDHEQGCLTYEGVDDLLMEEEEEWDYEEAPEEEEEMLEWDEESDEDLLDDEEQW
jgi:hypothetical protein